MPPPDRVDKKIPYSSVPFEYRTFEPNTDKNFQPDYHIYTDGSKIDDNVGLAVCVLNTKESKSIDTIIKKLDPFNSVFQAELTAISLAADWAISNNKNIHIFTDSLSSVLALQSTTNKSKYLFDIKEKLNKNSSKIKITWVKAHSGILGNEIADGYAKEAAASAHPTSVPLPYSLIKRKLKINLNYQWQLSWNNSKTGRRRYTFIQKINTKIQITHPSIIHFLTGHGPFLTYLKRFKIKSDDNCPCGAGTGDPDHYVFDCGLTAKFQLTKPTEENKTNWFNNVYNNNRSVALIINSIKISNEICNRIPNEQVDESSDGSGSDSY